MIILFSAVEFFIFRKSGSLLLLYIFRFYNIFVLNKVLSAGCGTFRNEPSKAHKAIVSKVFPIAQAFPTKLHGVTALVSYGVAASSINNLQCLECTAFGYRGLI